MIRSHHKTIIAFCVAFFSCQLQALNLQKYANSAQSRVADETSRNTLVGIIGNCGSANNIDDSCVIQSLERVATEENNTAAKAILSDYEKALNEGNYDQPECQTGSHMQVNRTIGHCLLLLNYYVIENNDNDAATAQYETCLQGGMLGLAYQGNMAAQYLLSDIFAEKNLTAQATLWKKSLETRKGSEEYELLMKCYR